MSGSRRKAIRAELYNALGRPPRKSEMRAAKRAYTRKGNRHG